MPVHLFGEYPAPSHTIAHISDTHLLAGEARLYNAVDTVANLSRALDLLGRLDPVPQAIVFTGDLTDLGEPDAYRLLREAVEPVAERLGAQVIWCMGNHDERVIYSQALFGRDVAEDEPQDAVYDVAGLRIISLDSTVPGWHHGEIRPEQREWLRDVLATPAEHGTIIAMHHPPLPAAMVPWAELIALHEQKAFGELVAGTDVRAILAGHYHYSSHSTLAGIPVSVASATCYAIDPAPLDRLMSGGNTNQTVNMVHVYDDRVVHTVVPLEGGPEVLGYPAEAADMIAALTPEQRHEMFANKKHDY